MSGDWNGAPYTPRRLNSPLIRVSRLTLRADEARAIVEAAKAAGLIKPAEFQCPRCSQPAPDFGALCAACRADSYRTGQAKRRYRQLTCPQCGAAFQTQSQNGIYCSQRCQKATKSPPEKQCFCNHCGTQFSSRYQRARYCSNCRDYSARSRGPGTKHPAAPQPSAARKTKKPPG